MNKEIVLDGKTFNVEEEKDENLKRVDPKGLTLQETCEKVLKDSITGEPPTLSGNNQTVYKMLDGDCILDGSWSAEEIMAIAIWINAGWPVEDTNTL